MRLSGLLSLLFLGLLLGNLAADDAKGKIDSAKMLGTWHFVSAVKDGKKASEEDLKKASVEITKETITLKGPDGNYVIKYELDPEKSPCHINMEITDGPQGKGSKATGIIALKDGKLELCYPPMGGDTPMKFEAKEGSNLHLFVMKHAK
jgi:uncharacterized protein (TIGR03067 family)